MFSIANTHILDCKISKFKLDVKTYLEMTRQKLLIEDTESEGLRRALSPHPEISAKLWDTLRDNAMTPTLYSRNTGKGCLPSTRFMDLKQNVHSHRRQNVTKKILKVSEINWVWVVLSLSCKLLFCDNKHKHLTLKYRKTHLTLHLRCPQKERKWGL